MDSQKLTEEYKNIMDHVSNIKLSKEFEFIRDKLNQIANLIATGNKMEAAFLIGCLHQVCHINSISLSQMEKINEEKGKESKNHL